MFRIVKLAALSLVVGGLAVANLGMARGHLLVDDGAHDWWRWHWDKTTLGVQIFGSHQSEARAARADWHNNTKLSLPLRSSHTDISVWGGNFGDTGWGGLASIEDYGWDWHCWASCQIKHGHARFNSYYGGSNSWWARGVHCQEIGHLFGLGHNNRGGCMGLGYYSNHTNRPSSHDRSDVNNKY